MLSSVEHGIFFITLAPDFIATAKTLYGSQLPDFLLYINIKIGKNIC